MELLASLLVAFVSLNGYAASDYQTEIFNAKAENTPHQIKIFNHGLASLEERLQMIERAEKTIDVEYFIYNSDVSGRIVTQALIARAKEGVKVRLLLDHLMIIKKHITPFHVKELAQYGIEVKFFNATSLIHLSKIQYRNHRKFLIIDGKEALTGGRNIGDEYFDLSEKHNFLDRDISVKGQIVDAVQASFNVIWESDAVVKIERPNIPKKDAYFTEEEETVYQDNVMKWQKGLEAAKKFVAQDSVDADLLKQIRTKGKEALQLEYRGECQDMKFYSEYPIIGRSNRSVRVIKPELARRFNNAQGKVIFESTYFINDTTSEKALKDALKRKVEIKLLTNGLYSTDAVYVFNVFDTYIKQWVKRGIDPYIYNGTKPENYSVLNENIARASFGVHAKSFVFDDKDVMIGSFNFHPHAANYNLEAMLSCENNPELAKVVRDDIELRMQASSYLHNEKVIDETRFGRVGILKRISYHLLLLPSNIFSFLL